MSDPREVAVVQLSVPPCITKGLAQVVDVYSVFQHRRGLQVAGVIGVFLGWTMLHPFITIAVMRPVHNVRLLMLPAELLQQRIPWRTAMASRRMRRR